MIFNYRSVAGLAGAALLLFGISENTYSQGCDCGPDHLKENRQVVEGDRLASPPFMNIVHIRVKRWYSRPYFSTATLLNGSALITARHNVIRKSHIRKLWIEGQTQTGR